MRKLSITLIFLVSLNALSQNRANEDMCGFDEYMRQNDLKYPGLEKSRKETEARLKKLNKQSYLSKVGATSSWNGLYTGNLFEIPIVVHIIESGAPENADLIVTDQNIIDWVERTNKMYATTYGNGFYPEGIGPDGGTVMPFKLVLAKRSPQCTATNGIVRYNGSPLPFYDTGGIDMFGQGHGASPEQIKALAPHWPESSYFNIYLIIGFKGNQHSSSGTGGIAPGPNMYDTYSEAYIKAASVTKPHSIVLAHEMGHTFGLWHTFTGISESNQTTCPINNDCTIDGDEVCDTSPSRSMYGILPVPDNSSIDPCTGQNYDGTQYNIMNYTSSNRKFTQGQRDKAIFSMTDYRKDLLNSFAGKDLSVVIPSQVSVIPAQCNPSGIINANHTGYGIGPNRVQFGSISTMSNGYHAENPSTNFYDDYTMATCIRPAYHTDIPLHSGTELSITYNNGFNVEEKYRTKVWIDYNNNGLFENNELVVNHLSDNVFYNNTITETITPPPGAVTNTYLRMRIAVDLATFNGVLVPEIATACSPLQYGQMEDYAVRITGVLDTSKGTIKESGTDSAILYVKSENKIKLSGENNAFGDYQIYQVNGHLIQQGTARTNEIVIDRELPKGTFIINYSGKNRKESKKFLNN